MQQNFDEFVITIQEQGWALSKIVLKIPSTAPFLSKQEVE